MLFVINFLFCLFHVYILTKGGLEPWVMYLNWFALGMNSTAVILQLLT